MPRALKAAEDLLNEGKPRAAIETLAAVPWSAPEAKTARRLIAEISTRIDLAGPEAGAPRPRVDLFLAGKLWPTTYVVRLKPLTPQPSSGVPGESSRVPDEARKP